MKFKINWKGMKVEGKLLKAEQRMWLRKILKEGWLYESGWGDKEYIRLHHILMDDKYFSFDVGMLNTIRGTWLKGKELV